MHYLCRRLAGITKINLKSGKILHRETLSGILMYIFVMHTLPYKVMYKYRTFVWFIDCTAEVVITEQQYIKDGM
jgi:hypothetical protein